MFSTPDKSALGNRYVCYECGTKFYDLTKPEPLCPECGADQREAPVRDLKALLGGGKSPKHDPADDLPDPGTMTTMTTTTISPATSTTMTTTTWAMTTTTTNRSRR